MSLGTAEDDSGTEIHLPADIDWEMLDKSKFFFLGAALFSGVSGMLYPIVVLKTRKQVLVKDMPCLKLAVSILRHEGCRGFYRGFGTSLMGTIPARALYMGALEMTKSNVGCVTVKMGFSEAKAAAIANAAAGLSAAMAAQMVWTPIDVVSQRLMVQGGHGAQIRYNGGIDAFRKIIQTDGVRGLYRGFGISILTYAPSNAVWWVAYSMAHRAVWGGVGCYYLKKEGNGNGNGGGFTPDSKAVVAVQAASAAMASGFSAVVTMPLDTIKTSNLSMAATPSVSWNYLPKNYYQRSKIFSAGPCPISSKPPHKENPRNTSLKAFRNAQISSPITAHGSQYKFLQPGTQRTRSNRIVSLKSAGSDSSITSNLLQTALGVVHLVVSLGIILATDKYLKQAFVAAAIKFPSALFGMFCIFTVLVILDVTIPAAAKGLENFFEPALLFIQRWLPLFYVPSLVVLPLAIQDIPAASGVKICFILVGGWLASLAVAGYTAIAVRKMVKTEMVPAEPMAKPSAFSTLEVAAWSVISVASFAAALKYPELLGTNARTCLPFLLGSTVLGYMVGTGLPSGLKKVFHPIICCALAADLAAFAFGYFSKSGLYPILGYYLTKVSSNPGAGDILMGFLGSVILSFAFSMFKQRKLVKRHAAEIFTSISIATLFSLYSTALLGRLVGLEPTLTISILPRCITVALALSIVSLFEGANSSLTAAAVVVTGLIGANFVQAVLDKLKFDDPIARGIATASSAHGLGTAALSAKEPEALPFCAIAYGLTGIFGSLVCSVPAVRQSLLAIVNC